MGTHQHASSSPARGYSLQDAWCWVWLLLGGVCGGVACPGYMCLAIHFITFSGADFLYCGHV